MRGTASEAEFPQSSPLLNSMLFHEHRRTLEMNCKKNYYKIMGTLKAHHCLPVSSKKSKNLKNSQKSLHAAATTQRQLRVTAFTVFNQQ